MPHSVQPPLCRNLDSKVWYCFNDQVVNRASVEDIRKTYGGSSSHFSYTYSSSTNAYMLMYRKVRSRAGARCACASSPPPGAD